jgi:hypothetical protein
MKALQATKLYNYLEKVSEENAMVYETQITVWNYKG